MSEGLEDMSPLIVERNGVRFIFGKTVKSGIPYIEVRDMVDFRIPLRIYPWLVDRRDIRKWLEDCDA